MFSWGFLVYLSIGAFLTIVASLRVSSLWPVAIASFFAAWPIDLLSNTSTLAYRLHVGSITALAIIGWIAARLQQMRAATLAWGLTAPIAILPYMWAISWQLTVIVLIVAVTAILVTLQYKARIIEKAKEKAQAAKAALTKNGSRP